MFGQPAKLSIAEVLQPISFYCGPLYLYNIIKYT